MSTIENTTPEKAIADALALLKLGYTLTIESPDPCTVLIKAGNLTVCAIYTTAEPLRAMRGASRLLRSIAPDNSHSIKQPKKRKHTV